jgi:sulfatase modifying factor 1
MKSLWLLWLPLAMADDEDRVSIDATTFLQGHPEADSGPYGNYWKENEFPAHEVTVDDFALDRTEVTVAAWAAFLNDGAGPVHHHALQPVVWEDGGFVPVSGSETGPIRYVTWYDAAAYCAWAGGRLPSEAEWELAAKGDEEENNRYPWGDDGASCSKAVYYTAETLCADAPQDVGDRPDGDSVFGLADMGGNVAEWVFDFYDRYDEDAQENPKGPREGDLRILRGGGFRETAHEMRPSARSAAPPDARSEGVGFRCGEDR